MPEPEEPSDLSSIAPAGADQGQVERAIVREPLGPIREGERLLVLDVLRGVAMLGILFVNMLFFSMPVKTMMGEPGLVEGPVVNLLSWGLVQVFFLLKFISLFSLLFGVGLVVQMTRAEAKGRPFAGVYLRRLGVLAVFGLCHGLLLWYGDVLFIYAVLGLPLLLLRKLSGKTLLWLSLAMVGFSVVMALGCGSLQVFFSAYQPQQQSADTSSAADDGDAGPEIITEETVEESAEEAPEGESIGEEADVPADAPAEAPPEQTDLTADDEKEEAPRGWAAIVESQGQPNHPIWAEGEIEAYKHGPFSEAVVFRSVSYGYAILAAGFGYGWRVLGMFCLGAALMKLGFFLSDRGRWHRRFLFLGLGIGLPLELAAAGVQVGNGFQINWVMLPASLLHESGSFLLCLGYIGGICMLVHGGLLRGVLNAFACVGRLALSVYLMETIICTGLMYWWGLGLFDDFARWQLLPLVLAVYAVLMIAASIWLRVFTIGPFEWLWRSLTYGRVQPMLRKRDG